MDSSNLIDKTEIKSEIEDKINSYDLILKKLEILSKKVSSFLKSSCVKEGRISSSLLEKVQYKSHGYAWFETYRISLRELLQWYKRLSETNKNSPLDALVLAGGFSEYLMQIKNGIMMSQSEIIRPEDLGLASEDFGFFNEENVCEVINYGLSEDLKNEIVKYLCQGNFPSLGLGDETLEMIQDQFKKFTDEEIIPEANEWHLADKLIPDEILSKMSDLGVFSIAIPEEYGGLGMGKVAMCVVTEELSRGFLAAGSLGTRAEIAGELIRLGGTEEQKQKYLSLIHI